MGSPSSSPGMAMAPTRLQVPVQVTLEMTEAEDDRVPHPPWRKVAGPCVDRHTTEGKLGSLTC